MASVKSSRAKTYQTKTSVAEGEAPEHVPSEGELLVKEMVKKQLDTRLSLDHQLQAEKQFEKATEFESVTRYVSGQSTLKDFEASTSKVERKEDLHSFGLTAEEIQLLLDRDKDDKFFDEKYKNVEGSVLQSRLDAIQTKIDAGILKLRAEERSSEDRNRHEQEIDQSIQPSSDLSKLLQFASKSKPITRRDTRPPSHPINQLKEIEQQLFGHIQKPAKTKRKKIKRQLQTVPVFTESHVDETQPSTSSSRKRLDSHWDEKTVPAKKSGSLQREYSCKPEILYTIKDKKIVRITQSAVTVGAPPEQHDKSCGPLFGKEFVLSTAPDKKDELTTSGEQLSIEKMRELARFSDYSPGIPSKVLYLKNLPNNVKEEDLVGMFSQFESKDAARVTYRLMGGKMKGQAFVTFSDVETASAAFQAVNGCFLKGRPVIIQFGKSG